MNAATPPLLALLCLLPLSVRAEAPQTPDDNPRIYVWGIKQGCALSPTRTEAVRRYLRSIAYPAVLLRVPPELQSCQGEECVQLLNQRCPGTRQGVLLGGRVEEINRVVRLRLWMFDFAAQRTAYQDGYCNGCELDESLTTSVAEIIERPSFEPRPGPLPIYCTPSSESAAAPTPIRKIFYLAHGESRQRLALTALLGDVILKSGIKGEPAAVNVKSLNLEVLNRIVAKESAARVIWTEQASDNKVAVWIFDQPSQRIDSIPVDCPGCDQQSLLSKSRTAAERLIDRCLGGNCAVVASPMQRPTEACLPYAACEGPEGVALPMPMRQSAAGIDPALARGVKGLLWGLVAAGAVTTVALLGANYGSAGSFVDPAGYRIGNVLLPGVGVAAGATGLLLGAAIPMSIILDRASGRTSRSGTATGFQCPN